MQVGARLEICVMQVNRMLYYCTLLLTCQILSLAYSAGHFGTLLKFYSLFG